MNQSTPPPPPINQIGCDSLSADLVVADDSGGFTVYPADPEELARYLDERRKLPPRPAPKRRESES